MKNLSQGERKMIECSDFASSEVATLSAAIPFISVYGYWYSAGFSPAFPQAIHPGLPAPCPAQPSVPLVVREHSTIPPDP
ncbi:MAG: hypothetical protein RSA59_03980, partial [Raoultibacter sp.]